MKAEQLQLKNQVCFPLYATSRLIIQQYKPLLQKLDITYPQYLVLLVLWEENNIPVKEISKKLLLESNTLTPLLKRMETNGLLSRNRSTKDERVVTISLTQKGIDLKQEALNIPSELANQLLCSGVDSCEIEQLKQILDKMLATING